MKNYKTGDSLVGVIIGIFILSIALLGILNVLGFNQNTLSIYNASINKYIIGSNIENVIKKIDNNDIITGGTGFYIYKDTINKEFKYLTGSANESYQYVDKLFNKTNPSENLSNSYKVKLEKKVDILRHVVYPPEIEYMSFHFDANNVNGNNNIGTSDGFFLNEFHDISGNGNHAHQSDPTKQPILEHDVILNKPGVRFDGIDDMFEIDDDGLINTDGTGGSKIAGILYSQRTIAIVLKTGFNIIDDQMIYEEGGTVRGYSYMIHNGDLYAGIWNDRERDVGNQYKSVNLGTVYPDTIYFITIVQDSSHGEYLDTVDEHNNTFDDSSNSLKIYLNGELANSTNHVDPQVEHSLNIGLGAMNDGTILPRSPYNQDGGDEKYHFQGYIGELIEWNNALTTNEVRGIQNYLKEKWYGATSNIQYHRIDSSVKKVQ